MKLNDFEVIIPEGDETEVGHVCLKHGTQYSIKLRNHSERLLCNATVKIDGRSVGTWRVAQSEAITIERPVHDSGRFTFYQEGTAEAAKADIRQTEELGLISVLFRPEKRKDVPLIQHMAAPRPYAAGGTGLSGKSAQQFVEAEEIEIDDEGAVTIHLRLVAVQSEPRPLFPFETPVPPAVQTKTDDTNRSGIRASNPPVQTQKNSKWVAGLILFGAAVFFLNGAGATATAGWPRFIYIIWLAILSWKLGRGTSLKGYTYFWRIFGIAMLVSGLCGSFEMLFREAKTPAIIGYGFYTGFVGMIIISAPWCLFWWLIARPFRKKLPLPGALQDS